MIKLNIGCGAAKLEGYQNIDINPTCNPDIVLDITQDLLPFPDNSVDRVTIFHTIEHVFRDRHQFILGEINRVLIEGSQLLISFPNAEVCLRNFLNNKHGDRVYWERTILGRGQVIWDCHLSLIYVDDFLPFLAELGFGKFKMVEEVNQPQNTIISAVKLFTAIERTELLRKEVVNAQN